MSYKGFDNTDSWLETSAAAFTGQGYPLTMVAWVKGSSADWANSSIGTILGFSQAPTDWYTLLQMRVGNGGAYASVRDLDYNYETAFEAVSAYSSDVYDKWVPICVVFDGSGGTSTDYTVYVLNSSYYVTGSDAAPIHTDLDSLRVGQVPNQDDEYFPGNIAEVALFDVAWDTTKVDQLRTAAETGPAPYTIDSDNCIGYWSLNSDQTSHASEGGISGPALDEKGSVAYDTTPDHPTITSGDIEQTVNQITETDTVGAIAGSKQKLIGQLTETDIAQAISSGLIIPVGQITETDLSQAVAMWLGYTFIELVDPITTEGSLLEGYTGDAPVTGDTLFAKQFTSPSGIAVTLNADGTFSLASAPTSNQTISRVVVQADGTVGVEEDYTVEVELTVTVNQVNETDVVHQINLPGQIAVPVGTCVELQNAYAIILPVSSTPDVSSRLFIEIGISI